MNTGKKYKTKQRENILQCIMENAGSYVTIQQLLQQLESKGQAVGIATIYRHLEKLVQEKKIAKVYIEGVKGTCFKYNEADDAQTKISVKCEDCGKLMDITCPQLEKLYTHVEEMHHIFIDPEKTIFYGKCDTCQHQSHKEE